MVHVGRRYPYFQEARILVADSPYPLWPACEYLWRVGSWGGTLPTGIPFDGRGLVPIPWHRGDAVVTWQKNYSFGLLHVLSWFFVMQWQGPTHSPTFTAIVLLDGATQGKTPDIDVGVFGLDHFIWSVSAPGGWIPASGATITPLGEINIQAVPWTAVPPPTVYGPPYFVTRP